MTDVDPQPADDAGASELAPRPRPGFRSRQRSAGAEKAHLFAGVVRAGAGAAGLFAALLYLPIQTVTPILAGVSILMMVTGCTSSWRVTLDAPALKRIPLVLIAGCVIATAATVVLTLVVGAGALGPLADLKAQRAHDQAGVVTFQAAP